MWSADLLICCGCSRGCCRRRPLLRQPHMRLCHAATRPRLRYATTRLRPALCYSRPVHDPARICSDLGFRSRFAFCISRISRAAARAHMISRTLRPYVILTLPPPPVPPVPVSAPVPAPVLVPGRVSVQCLSCACVVNVPIIRHLSRIRLPHARGVAPRPAGARVGVACVHTAPPSSRR